MKIINSHLHFGPNCNSETIQKIITQQNKHEIVASINCATKFDNWEKCIALSKKNETIKCALGLHPYFVNNENLSKLKSLNFSCFNFCTAISEIGIDKVKATASLQDQIDVFIFFLDIAKQLNIPTIIHCVNAIDEVIKCIKYVKPNVPIVFHAFNGNKEMAMQLEKFNFYFSIKNICYKSKRHCEMINYIHKNLMLIETDEICQNDNAALMMQNTILETAKILNVDENNLACDIFETSKKVFNI